MKGKRLNYETAVTLIHDPVTFKGGNKTTFVSSTSD